MTTALACGFLHHIVAPDVINFERLHIFLFNLVSGGTLLIYFTEDRKKLSPRGVLFLVLAILFALCAFFQWYQPTLVIPLILALIIEKVRVEHFGGWLPMALFDSNEATSRKFHQASLLCLSLGLTISSIAILNSQFTHWFSLEKLKLDTFFLGFSFPISLISMSVIFSLMKNHTTPTGDYLKEFSFWVINLGVIVFFLFILAGWFLPQVFISVVLFITVTLILYLYYRLGIRLQQKTFLTSGILFLVVTSITGIIYILLAFSQDYDPQRTLPLLRMHAFTALYGWNLSGLAVISRHGDFPIKLHSQKVIALHWLTVLILCPLGYFLPVFGALAVIGYGWLLHILLFNSGQVDTGVVTMEDRVLGHNPKQSDTVTR
ncbi:hypothetical protein SAMN05660330_00058 [Desulforhopalus singaporensis]|uniref:Uncharacterized protein n=2 Tax=Desulforhopalus singaporensis TaxID=91360 RepID=A0A1H0IWU0_9BACT|nr:hypothetical protein SAMN05660330_00058 [Desulforhopalus singaporensis]